MSSPSSIAESAFEEAFKLPDLTGDSGRASSEPDIIYYENHPVYAVVDKPVEAEDALQHAFTCQAKYLSKIPPMVVTENYCFILDGDQVKTSDLIKEEDKWWKQTGKPVHYYYSDDCKTFRRVQCSLHRGRIISARLSVPKRSGTGHDQKEVPLAKVFRAARYYSHWNSCISFHRIVTIMSRVSQKKTGNDTVKRIFVQYLWRDVKPSDKAKVAAEYASSVRHASPMHHVLPSSSKTELFSK